MIICILAYKRYDNLIRLLSNDYFRASVLGAKAQVWVLLQQISDVVIEQHIEPHTFPGVVLFHTDQNMGCAGGRAFLTRRVLAHADDDPGAPVMYPGDPPRGPIIYLDDDIQVTRESWLMRLVRPFVDPLVGIVGVDGRRIDAEGWSHPAHDESVDYVSGGWCAIRAEVFLSGCMFDMRFNPNYYEDADLCFQAKAAGWQIRIAGNTGLVHEPHSFPAGTYELVQRNRRLFVAKHLDTLQSGLCVQHDTK